VAIAAGGDLLEPQVAICLNLGSYYRRWRSASNLSGYVPPEWRSAGALGGYCRNWRSLGAAGGFNAAGGDLLERWLRLQKWLRRSESMKYIWGWIAIA
jgi:hypothetical protein